MSFNAEQLEHIEEFAYQLFTPTDIATALEVDPEDFLDEVNTIGSDAHRAFWKGYLRQIKEIKADTIKAARNGSNPAQMELLKYIQNIQREVKHG